MPSKGKPINTSAGDREWQIGDSGAGLSDEEIISLRKKPAPQRSGAEESIVQDNVLGDWGDDPSGSGAELDANKRFESEGFDRANGGPPLDNARYPDALLSEDRGTRAISDKAAGYDQAAYDAEVDSADEGEDDGLTPREQPSASRGPASVLDKLIPSASAADEPPPKGALQLKALRDEGVSEGDIRVWKSERVQALRDEKVPEEEIRRYFGDPEYDPKPMAKLAETVLDWHPPMVKPDHEIGAKQAEGFLESIQSGYQGSALGLAKRGKLPDLKPKPDANFAEIVGHAVGAFAGDTAVGLPASIATTAGVGIGASAMSLNPAVGAGAGTVAGIFNFGFVPGAVRRSLIDYYNKGEIDNSSEFLDRLTSATVQGVKGGVINLATAGAGKLGAGVAGNVAAKVGAKTAGAAQKIAAKAGSLAAEIPTMAAAGPAMEGRLPEKDDFYHAAVGVLALNAGVTAVGKTSSYVKGKAFDAMEARVTSNVQAKIEKTYTETGIHPTELSAMMDSDPLLHAEVLSGSTDVPKSLEPYLEKAPDVTKVQTELPAELGGGEHTIDVPNEPKVAMGAEPPKAPEGTLSPEAEGKSIRKQFEAVTPEELSKMSRETAEKLVLSRFRNTPDGEGDFMALSKDEFRRRVIDRYDPILRAQKLFTGTKTTKDAIAAIPASENPVILAANMSGVAGKVLTAIEDGTRDFKTRKKTGESLTAITDKYQVKLLDSPETRAKKEADTNGLRAYIAAKRIAEVAKRDVNKGADAVSVLKTIEEGKAKYEKDANRLIEFQRRVLQYGVDAGIKSPEEAAAMRAAGESYLPLNHIIEGKESPFSGRGKLTVKDPFKEMKKGSDAPIIEPIEQLVKNTHEIYAMSERNRVMQATRNMMKNFPELMKLVETEKGKKLFNEAGEEVRQFRELSKTEIAVYDEGVRNVYEVPEDIATAFRGMDESTLGLLEKVLAKSATILRQGATLTPEFVLKNVFRDQLHAFVLSNNNYIPGISYVSGLLSMVKKDEWFQKYRDSGALGATINSFDKKYVHSNILDVSQKTGMLKTSWNVVKSPFELGHHILSTIAEYGEQPTRIGEFKRSLKGKDDIDSIFKAGYDARNVTIDFARRGANVAAMNAMIPFFNAKNQGLDQLATALKENTARTLVKGATLAVPSVLLWMANKDDPRYKELKEWEKTLFWHVFTDKWVPAMKDEEGLPMSRQKEDGTWEMNTGHVLRIAKPQGLNLLFNAPVEAMLDQFTLDDPHGAELLAKAIMTEFIPDAPQLPKLYNDMKSNYSSFRDKEIVPYFVEKRSPPFRYSPWGTEAGKWMSLQLAKAGIKNDFTSPPMIDYAVQGMAGGLGLHALEAVSYGLTKMGLVPKEMKQKDWDELPFVKSFTTRMPESSESVDRYYKYASEAAAPLLDLKAATKEKRLTDIAYITAQSDYKVAVQMKPQFAAAKRSFKAIKENIEMIEQSKDLTADDKTRLVDAQMFHRMQIARQINKEMSRVKKAVAAGKDPAEAYTHVTPEDESNDE